MPAAAVESLRLLALVVVARPDLYAEWRARIGFVHLAVGWPRSSRRRAHAALAAPAW